jgi:hypothetical protein
MRAQGDCASYFLDGLPYNVSNDRFGSSYALQRGSMRVVSVAVVAEPAVDGRRYGLGITILALRGVAVMNLDDAVQMRSCSRRTQAGETL